MIIEDPIRMPMYMSRMQMDLSKRKTMQALANPNLFHGAVEQSFPCRGQKKLWRVDSLHGKTYLMIISDGCPDLSSAAEQFGFPDAGTKWETRSYDPLLKKISDGGQWHFRLVAYPTHSVMEKKDVPGQRGKVYPHVTPHYQKKWLLDRAAKHGFELTEDSFQITGHHSFSFKKSSDQGRRVSLLAVTFEGILTIIDSALFRNTLIDGIGRGKAYGMGMLTVAGRIK